MKEITKVKKVKTRVLVMKAIEEYWCNHTRSPSIRDIANIVGISLTAAAHHIKMLENDGKIKPVNNKYRSIVPTDMTISFDRKEN